MFISALLSINEYYRHADILETPHKSNEKGRYFWRSRSFQLFGSLQCKRKSLIVHKVSQPQFKVAFWKISYLRNKAKQAWLCRVKCIMKTTCRRIRRQLFYQQQRTCKNQNLYGQRQRNSTFRHMMRRWNKVKQNQSSQSIWRSTGKPYCTLCQIFYTLAVKKPRAS